MSERKSKPCPNCDLLTRLNVCPRCGAIVFKKAESTPEPEEPED